LELYQPRHTNGPEILKTLITIHRDWQADNQLGYRDKTPVGRNLQLFKLFKFLSAVYVSTKKQLRPASLVAENEILAELLNAKYQGYLVNNLQISYSIEYIL